MTAPVMELRRTKEAIPIEAGWYYGRENFIQGSVIMPRRVVNTRIPDYVLVEVAEGWAVAYLFDWYGSVPTCKESGT